MSVRVPGYVVSTTPRELRLYPISRLTVTVKLNHCAFENANGLNEEGKFVADEREAWSEHHPSTRMEKEFIEQNGFVEYGRRSGAGKTEDDRQQKTPHICSAVAGARRGRAWHFNSGPRRRWPIGDRPRVLWPLLDPQCRNLPKTGHKSAGGALSHLPADRGHGADEQGSWRRAAPRPAPLAAAPLPRPRNNNPRQHKAHSAGGRP